MQLHGKHKCETQRNPKHKYELPTADTIASQLHHQAHLCHNTKDNANTNNLTK